MLRSATLGHRSRLVPLAAMLVLPLVGCTEHRSIFDTDAGTPDAGSPDGGAPDGGAPDGGPGDGGIPDGGVGAAVSIRIAGLSGAPLEVGASVALQVLALDAAGNQSDVTAQATLASSNTAVATLAGAQLTAVARGTTIIEASLAQAAGSPLVASAAVTVVAMGGGMTVAVQVAPATLSLAPGLGAQLAANATQGDGTQRSVTTLATWTTSAASVCTVDDANQKGYVTAVAFGTCTVTAAFGGQQGAAVVSVQQLTVTALTVAPTSAQLAAGGSVQLSASATLSNGSIADATHTATWTSSDTSKATVAGGLVSGAAPGSATVTAALSGQTATAQITVTAATLTSLSLAPPSTTIAAGLTQQLTATAVYSDGSTVNVTSSAAFSSDTPAVAAIDANTAGLVDALSPGRATITATVSGVSGTATLDVTAATPTRITLTPSPITLPAGVSQQVTATALFSDNSVRNVSSDVAWSVGDATLATVGASGLLAGLAAGTTTLTAQLSGVSATDAVTVTAAQLAQILLLPQNSSISAGATQQLTATGIYGDNSLHDVTQLATWTTSSAANVSISNAAGTRGLATGVAAGTAGITASLDGITSAPASVTVTAATLSSISIAPAHILTAVYITVPTQVTARYADGSELDVTSQAVFSTGNAGVASVVAAGTGAGQVTGTGQGQTNITASFGGQTATAQATVAAATLQSITVRAPMGAIEVGQSVQFNAQAQFQGAPIGIDVTTLVTWTSSDQSVGIFQGTPNGTFTAESAGMTTVAAELDGVSGTLAVTVSPSTPVSIAVEEASFTLPVGVAHALVATGTYANGTTADVTYSAAWSSSANAVAVVGDSGTLDGIVTAVSPGTATITATLDGVSGQSTVTVDSATVSSILVTPISDTVSVGTGGGGPGGGGGGRGTEVTFYATGQFSDGTDQDITQSCNWTSSDPTIATVSDQTGTKGQVTVVAAGATTITASFRGLTGSGSLTAH